MDRKIVQQLLLKKSFNQITKEQSVGKRRVKKIYDLSKEYGYFDDTPLPPFPSPLFKYADLGTGNKSHYDELLLPHKKWILEKLEAGWKIITIFEELPINRTNSTLSSSTFYRFLHRHNILKEASRSETARVVPEILHEPGEVLQLDWGKLRDVIDPVTGKKRTLWAFVGIVGFSRYMMVKFVWDNKTETTIQAIEEMFNELGGVRKKIVSDNPKCFSIEASKYEPILNPAFERFCAHYNVIPEILSPRDPQKKGKVERAMPYVRRLYEGHGLNWEGLEESQSYMNKKLVIANERTHGTIRMRPIDVLLQQEVSFFYQLPAIRYDIEEYHTGKVRKDGHVRFRNKYYSVDEKYHGKEVFVIGNSRRIEIYSRCELIETHNKIKGNHTSKSTKKQHLKPWEQVAQDSGIYINKAKNIGPNTEQFISEILALGRGFVDTRKIWGVLSLDKDHDKKSIDLACKYALEIESLSYQTVRSFLNISPKRKFNIKINNKKFVRDVDEYKKQLQ